MPNPSGYPGCGSFEDVGGISDSYCPSISARAFIAAYRVTGNRHYLDIAKEILSVSLSWVTTDFTRKNQTYWDDKYLFMPKWEGLGQLIQPQEGCEPIYFKDETGELWVLLTGNNTYGEIKPLTQKN